MQAPLLKARQALSGGLASGVGPRRCCHRPALHADAPRVATIRRPIATSIKGLVEESAHNWRAPLTGSGTPGASDVIVALGKFDALHLGHQTLAVRAAQMGGQPCLLSFSGMAEVLGWPIRPPLVAHCDRPRVLKSWEHACLGRCPRQRSVPFHEIRTMSPEEFVRLLAEDLQAVGVVAGSNYRFGYKAAGDANTLRQLGAEYGLEVSIVDLLEDQHQSQVQAQLQAVVRAGSRSAVATSTQDLVRHYVSSTKARELLSKGDVSSVAFLLGRQYRLVTSLDPSLRHRTPHRSSSHLQPSSSHPSSSPPSHTGRLVSAQAVLPATTFLNKAPACGEYEATLVVAHREVDGAAAAVAGLSPGSHFRCGGVLPLDLESGVGLPITIQVAHDGLHLSNEALDLAVSAAIQHHSGDQADRRGSLYAVIDFSNLVELD